MPQAIASLAGKYGAFIWPAYGLTALVFIVLIAEGLLLGWLLN